jgi:DNA primase
MDILRELIDFCAERPNMSTAQLLELWRDHPAQMHLMTLATWSLQGEAENLVQEFKDSLTGLELQWTEVLISRISPRTTELSPEEYQRWMALLQKRQELIKARSGLLQ